MPGGIHFARAARPDLNIVQPPTTPVHRVVVINPKVSNQRVRVRVLLHASGIVLVFPVQKTTVLIHYGGRAGNFVKTLAHAIHALIKLDKVSCKRENLDFFSKIEDFSKSWIYVPDLFLPPSGSITSTTVGQHASELSLKIPFLFGFWSFSLLGFPGRFSTVFPGSSTSMGRLFGGN